MNKGLRYQSESKLFIKVNDINYRWIEKKSFSISVEEDSKKKTIDYGYNGHRKIIYKATPKNIRNNYINLPKISRISPDDTEDESFVGINYLPEIFFNSIYHVKQPNLI